ncbi:RNA polymerase I-specific transcription initiation factor RRN3 [Xylariaceae sp. FL1019]|nr:RNA polymerase I-specific transcription initiation factor RRN3 [Xylariaceae sp. FL1019]
MSPAVTKPQVATPAVRNPLKPILKSSSSLLGVKRSISDTDLDDDTGKMDGSQSPRKRLRVEFDLNNIEVHEIGIRSVEDVKKEVKKALDQRDRGDNEDYDVLKHTLLGRPPSDDDYDDIDYDPAAPLRQRQELKVYLLALTTFAPRLGRSSDGLVRNVLQCQWLGRDDQFVKIYVQFLAVLVSAQGARLTQVLAMLVDNFTHSRPSDWAAQGYAGVSREIVQERLHVALRYMLSLFPAAESALGPILVSKYPFHSESKRAHLAYVDNLLKVRQYSPELRTDIMDLIISRLVKIDVEMQMDLEDMDDRLAAMVVLSLRSAQERPHLDDEESDDSDNESVFSDESEDEEYTRIKTAKDSVLKMDSVLNTLFELYTPFFADPDSEEAMEVFADLLAEFSNLILPTIKSRHTQFLIFHFGQKSESLMDAFCGTCINIAFESQRPLILQQSACAYLASFVARGAHVPGHISVKVFEVLGHRMEQMRATYEVSCRGPDVRRYAPFYALMQALMYVFCFKWQHLIRSAPEDVDKDDPSSYLDQDIEWEPEVKNIMRRNIHSKLNPLKICSPVIVDQFAKLAHRFRFMYVYPLIESNKRLRLSQFAVGAYSNGGALRDMAFDANDESWQQLGTFFPFDPYQLPQSKRWVDDDYIKWQSIPGLDADGPDDDDSNEEAGDEQDEVVYETATEEDALEAN